MQEKLHFEKLTLNDNTDIKVYEDAINYVFESPDIKNVAISGAYGAGKSSVLASYIYMVTVIDRFRAKQGKIDAKNK